MWGALQVAARLGAGARVLTVVPDGWERYASVEPAALSVDGLDFII